MHITMAYHCTLSASSDSSHQHPALKAFLQRLCDVLSQTPLPSRVAEEENLGKQTEQALLQALIQEFGEAFWKHDKTFIHVSHRDRADFYTQQQLGDQLYTIIIEADPTRGDSIAKKFVSRVACTTATSLVYVTLCYQGTQEGTVYESKKFMQYCASISERLCSENNQVAYLGFMPNV